MQKEIRDELVFYFTEKSCHRKFWTERLLTETPFDRTPFDRKAIRPKHHSTETPFDRTPSDRMLFNRTPFDRKFILPKGHMTDLFFNLISTKNSFDREKLRRRSFDRKFF
jgi:hypothetical protein